VKTRINHSNASYAPKGGRDLALVGCGFSQDFGTVWSSLPLRQMGRTS
jgi:hypothetical protein